MSELAVEGDAAGRLPARGRGSKWPLRIVLLAIAGAGIGLGPRWLKKKPIAVDVVRVERATVRDEVSSSAAGEVMAERHATVRAELSGRVLAVRRHRGERVRRGEIVVAVDAADLDARLLQSEAALAAQRAQAAQAEAHAKAAARIAERARLLVQKGAEAPRLYDDALDASREAQAALRAARGLYAQSDAAVRVARVARARAAITAPFSGLLVEVYPEQGDELSPAAPVFEIIDDGKLHVEATIDEADIGRVRVGQPATLKLDALPGRPIAGAVSKVGAWVRRDDKGARIMRIEVAVTDLAAATAVGLRAGMSANVDVRVAEKPDVASLPTSVIVGRGTTRTVYLVHDGVVHVQPIEVGLSSWERSEIIKGAAPGDLVVATLNAKGLEDGAPVTIAGTH